MDISTDLFIVSKGCIVTSDNVLLLDIERYSVCKQVLINHVMKELYSFETLLGFFIDKSPVSCQHFEKRVMNHKYIKAIVALFSAS